MTKEDSEVCWTFSSNVNEDGEMRRQIKNVVED